MKKFCPMCCNELEVNGSGIFCRTCENLKKENNDGLIQIHKNNDVLDYFPYRGKPRSIQKEILLDVQNAIKDGYKFIILQAPTGTGKSWVAATIGLWQMGSVILTPQKNLQEQYMHDFGNFMTDVKGKSNFGCIQMDEIKDCTFGQCVSKTNPAKHCPYYCSKDDFIIPDYLHHTENEQVVLSPLGLAKFGSMEKICHYWRQKRIGEISSFPVYNYSMFLKNYLNDLESPDSRTNKNVRNVLICDEAHSLEDVLVEEFSLTLSEDYASLVNSSYNQSLIQRITLKNTVEDVSKIIQNLIKLYQEEISILEEHTECSSYLSSKEHLELHPELRCLKHKKSNKKCSNCRKSINFLDSLDCFRCDIHKTECSANHVLLNNFRKIKLETILQNLLTINDAISVNYKNFVISSAQLSKTSKKYEIEIKPIIVSHLAAKLFDDYKHVIFMSSTIDESIFCKDMGIENVFFKSYDSPFPITNRIVERRYVTALNFSNKDTEMIKVVKEIERIFDEHPNDKGIIHVTSYEYLNTILNTIDSRFKDRLYPLTAKSNKDELIEIHKTTPGNQVIISPGCWEGVDLKDSQSRFQIIVKAPYLPLSNHVKAKTEHLDYGKEWYVMRALFKIIQGSGRSIRSKDDFARTYLLDYKIEELFSYSYMVPKWFQDSLVGESCIVTKK